MVRPRVRAPACGARLHARPGPPAGEPPGARRCLRLCDWYALAQVGRTTRVCWSARDRFPLLVLAEDGAEVWRVTTLERGPLAADAFAVHDEGFVRNDADEDIRGD